MSDEMSAEPVAWILTDEKINDLQVTTVETLVRRAKAAHYCNVYLRINGKDELYEADWIKHMRLAKDPQSPAQARAMEDCARYKDALQEIALAGMGGSPEMSEEHVKEWHARRAWEFIGIAARALSPQPEAPEIFPGTMDALNSLGVRK